MTIPTTIKAEYLRATAAEAALSARITALEKALPKIVPFGPGTPAQFLALMADMTIDVIEMVAGTYSGWHLFATGVDRTARPLLVRPAPGAAVIWDGADGVVPGGSVSSGLFYFGWTDKAAYITFDPAETGGSFRIQNYRIADTGLVATAWVEHFTMNAFTVRGCTAPATNGWTAHCVYVSSDGVHRGANVTFNDWDVATGDGLFNPDLEVSHTPGCAGVTAYRWKCDGTAATHSRMGFACGFDSTGILVDGFTFTNLLTPCNASDTCTGTVRNCTASGCGAPSFGPPLTDGGGNSWG